MAGTKERLAIVEHFRHNVVYDEMPDKAWELLTDGLTLGLFQIEEGDTAKRLARQIAPRSIEELALLVALNRPGPLRSGDADRLIKRREGKEDVTYPHEILSNILDNTFGVFVYQEQVIAFFGAIGYSLSEADHIRKIMGKKLVEAMQEEFPRYLERAQAFMPKATAERIWELVVNYSKYGFNKAHAVGYAMILAWTIYAKATWPTEFFMASIETNPKKVGGYISEAKRMEINVLPPHINHSEAAISKSGGSILYGFADIKGIGPPAAALIRESQPYTSGEDFFERCQANMGFKKLLIRAGALDSFGYRFQICEACGGKGKIPNMVPKKNGDGLKRVLEPCTCVAGFAKCEIPSVEERAETEVELLGYALTDQFEEIIAAFQEKISKLASYDDVTIEEPGTHKVPGIITEVKETKVGPTARRNPGEKMAHVRIGWNGKEIRFAAFPEEYAAFRYMMKERTLGEFTIKTTPRGAQLRKAYKYMLD